LCLQNIRSEVIIEIISFPKDATWRSRELKGASSFLIARGEEEEFLKEGGRREREG